MTKNNLTIYQGSDYGLQISIKQVDGITPVNLAGYTFLSQIKSSPADAEPIAEFTITFVGDPSLGVILLSLSDADTILLVDESYVWDIFGTVGETSTRIAGGDITVVPQVSIEEVTP
jgi:hypothetical protein